MAVTGKLTLNKLINQAEWIILRLLNASTGGTQYRKKKKWRCRGAIKDTRDSEERALCTLQERLHNPTDRQRNIGTICGR